MAKAKGAKTKGRGEKKIRPYFTTRNGKRIYASAYGYKGWPIG